MNQKSEIQISLDDFKIQDIFVFLRTEYKKKLLTNAIKRAGSQSKFATLVKKNINYPKIKQSSVSFLLKKDSLRLDLVYFICDYLKISLDFNKITAIKGFGTSKVIYEPKFEVELTPKLAQILANLYCDGSIEKNNCYVSTYMNGNSGLIQRFKQNFIDCFGNYDFYERETNVTNVRIPCFIGKILYQKFNLGKDRIPNQIMNSDKKIKSAYLQAAFDDEGSVHKDHGQIKIKMKPKSFIQDLQKIVREFSINTSDVIEETDKRNERKYYFFLISGMYNLRKFQEKIGFYHPKKQKRLIAHLRNIKTENYGYKAKNLVVKALIEYGPLTVKQIAQILKRDKRIIHTHLVKLKNMGLVDYTKVKRKFVYEHLWSINRTGMPSSS